MISDDFKQNKCILPWACLAITPGNNVKVCTSSSVSLRKIDNKSNLHEIWTKGERRCNNARIGIYLMAGGAITECWFIDKNQPDVDEFFSGVEAPAVDGFEPVSS